MSQLLAVVGGISYGVLAALALTGSVSKAGADRARCPVPIASRRQTAVAHDHEPSHCRRVHARFELRRNLR